MDRADFCTARLWRLAHLYGAHHGLYGKGKRVSTLTVLFGSSTALTTLLTPLSAVSLLVFCLLYTPCVAAIASVKRELGGKWAAGVVIGQCVIAWLMAGLVYGMGSLFI